MEGSLLEISLVARSIGEGINPVALLLIVDPVSSVCVAIGVVVSSVAVFLPAADTALVAVAVAEVLHCYHLVLHANVLLRYNSISDALNWSER